MKIPLRMSQAAKIAELIHRKNIQPKSTFASVWVLQNGGQFRKRVIQSRTNINPRILYGDGNFNFLASSLNSYSESTKSPLHR